MSETGQALGASDNRFVLATRFRQRGARLAASWPRIASVMLDDATAIRRRPHGRGAGRPRSAGTAAGARAHRRTPRVRRPRQRRAAPGASPWHRRSGRCTHRTIAVRQRARTSPAALLRSAPAAGPRLRRAARHPRRAGRTATAHAHAHRATVAPHARLDEGLPVLDARRGSADRRSQAVHGDRSAAAPLGAPEQRRRRRPPTRRSRARRSATPASAWRRCPRYPSASADRRHRPAASSRSIEPCCSASRAARAACCSASLRLRPSASPSTRPAACTSTVNVLS